MFAWPLTIVLIVFGLAGAPFLIALARIIRNIHAKHTVAMRPGRVETRVEDLSEEMAEFLGRSVEQFRQEGFEVAANLHNSKAVTGAQGTQIFFIHPREKDTAQVQIAHGQIGRHFAVLVDSTFGDGRRVATVSRRGVSVMPRNPLVDAINFSWVRDARVLCEAHRRRLELLGRTAFARKWPESDKITEWLDKLWDEEMRRSVELGHRFPDRAAQVYRYTWKGAIFATLKLLPFVRHFRARRRDARARRVWNKLKMDEFRGATPAALPRIPDVPPEAETPLQYLQGLTIGEIRRERVEGTLIVRIGGETVMRLLVRRGMDLAVIVFFTGCLALTLRTFYQVWSISPFLARLHTEAIWIVVILWLLFVVPSIFRLARGLSACKGTIVLSANKAGLSFRNTPGASEGQIPRDDIEGLRVTVLKSPFGRRSGRLSVRVFGARRRQVLVQAGEVATLMTIRKELSEAMGMEVPISPPPLPVNQA
jgi:hypothetical protein